MVRVGRVDYNKASTTVVEMCEGSWWPVSEPAAATAAAAAERKDIDPRISCRSRSTTIETSQASSFIRSLIYNPGPDIAESSLCLVPRGYAPCNSQVLPRWQKLPPG